MLNAHDQPVDFSIPGSGQWEVALVSGEVGDSPDRHDGNRIVLAGRSFALQRGE